MTGMKTYIRKYFLWVLFIAIICSCSSGSNQKKNSNEKSDSKTEKVEVESQTETSEFILPSTVQIGQIFKKAGLNYVEGVANPTEKSSKYTSRVSKLLIYGVYSTDLSYCVLNDQSQSALNYLNTLKSLSEDIGFGEIYQSKDLFSRFEKNLGIQDSVLDIMIEIQERTDYYVEDYDLNDEALIIFIGAWVEGMHLGVEASNNMSKNAISIRLLEQMTILDNLLDGVDKLSKGKDISELYVELSELRDYFNKIDGVKKSKKSIIELEISFSNLSWMAEKIQTIRNRIVK